MSSPHEVFCESSHEVFIESSHGVRGCAEGGWRVCVCEVVDPGLAIFMPVSPQQQSPVIASEWTWSWGVEGNGIRKFARASGAGRSTSAGQVIPLTVGFGIASEKILSGDFISLTRSKISRNKADGLSTRVWAAEATQFANSMALDGINRRVFHGDFTGSNRIISRDVDTGEVLSDLPVSPPYGRISQIVAIPVEPGGAYVRQFTSRVGRLSPSGTFLWSIQVPESTFSISVDHEGFMYACGGVWTVVSFTIQIIKSFVRKYSLSGGLIWEWSETGTWDSSPQSDEPVQLPCKAATGDASRVFVLSDYASTSGTRFATALVLDASTGAFIQRVDVQELEPSTGADSNIGASALWVTPTTVLVAVKSSGLTPYAVLALKSTPQENGLDLWTTNDSLDFASPIKTIRPIVTLSEL